MAPSSTTDKRLNIRQLRKDLEALEPSSARGGDGVGHMSDYHKNLLKWARNVDQRYAWVLLVACFVIMMSSFGPFRLYGLIFAAITKEAVYNREEASWPFSMILTLENVGGSFVSILVYYIGLRNSILIGGLLMTISNLVAYFSRALWLDVLFIGIIQGTGYAFIFTPYMEIMNGYFVRYRNFTMAIVMCGGTFANFILSPIFQWILANYHWRAGYLGIFVINCFCLLMVPLLKPNIRPAPPLVAAITDTDHPTSIMMENQNKKQQMTNLRQFELLDDRNHAGSNEFDKSLIWEIVTTSAFHLIWYLQVVYFWTFSILSLVIVDYGVDRGLARADAQSLVRYIAVGEISGRLILAFVADMHLLPMRHIVALDMTGIAVLIVVLTQSSSFYSIALCTLGILGLASVLYVLLNVLFVEYLSEEKVTLSFGLSSCISGILMLLRPYAVGFCRDYLGTYTPLLVCLSAANLSTALLWVLEPKISKFFAKSRSGDDASPTNNQERKISTP